MFKRILKEKIISNFFSGKVIIIVGPRQVGKTTLMDDIIDSKSINSETVRFNCDYIEDRELLNEESLKKVEKMIGEKKYIFIDEGQKVEKIGPMLKILADFYKDKKQIVASGSSSINILDKTSEPLTGRKVVYKMYPVSLDEMKLTFDLSYIEKNLENFLIFGTYPRILSLDSYEKKINELYELTGGGLYKDILEFQDIKNSNVIIKLLKALALQIGSEVSLHEIGGIVNLDLRTVERYIDLLEKSFILFRLPPYFTNKRKELSKMNKIYFYDLGIRNAIINNFNFLDSRDDAGKLFENFIISERMKYRDYYDIHSYQYFWRNYNKSEIDLLEEYNGKLHAYEIKWNKDKVKPPLNFMETYNNSEFNLINKKNYYDFLLKIL